MLEKDARSHGVQLQNVLPFDRWVKNNCTSRELLINETKWSSIFSYTLWAVRNARNDLVFNQKIWKSEDVVALALSMAKEAKGYLYKKYVF